MALIMEGKPAAAAIRARLTEKAGKLRDQGVVCGLAVVLVGDDHASIIYADWLSKLCSSLGIRYHLAALPADTTQEELLAQIAQLNASPEVSGILPMMPLPAQMAMPPHHNWSWRSHALCRRTAVPRACSVPSCAARIAA